MKIRFVQSCSTDGPSYAAGHTYELPKAEGQGFVAAGLAVAVAPTEKVETGTLFEEAETATVKGAAESAKARRRTTKK